MSSNDENCTVLTTIEEPNVTYVPTSSLDVLSVETRTTFFWIILLIWVFTIIGNVSAIYSISRRKCKILQKTCIISLAISDIFTASIYSLNHLDGLTHEYFIWSLGEFLCHFIPMAQIAGTTASSVALFTIALDRYQNVIYALKKRWTPSLTKCLFGVIIVWIICSVLAYPLYHYYSYESLVIVEMFKGDPCPKFQKAALCVTVVKGSVGIYFALMCTFIFLPLFVVFLWFYYNIAVSIWRHRKPLQSRYIKGISELESGNTKSTELTNNSNTAPKSIMKKTKNVQMERKIRTFRIVIMLMMVFITCRLPYLAMNLKKLLYPYKNDSNHSRSTWNLNFSLLSLNILNCALNPLLYTFLNQTITFLKKSYDFMVKVMCCFCNDSDFEDYEKDSPIVCAYFDQRRVRDQHLSTKVKFNDTHRRF